jgi:hypothetical protein
MEGFATLVLVPYLNLHVGRANEMPCPAKDFNLGGDNETEN